MASDRRTPLLLYLFSKFGYHASYNVAKMVVEFEYQEEIPPSRLRTAHGDGFQGAPLRCQLSGEGLFPQDTATCDGKATQGSEGERVATTSAIELLTTPVHAPRANAICERFLRSVRQECLNHLFIFSEKQHEPRAQ